MSEIQNQGDLRQVRLDKFNELKRVGRNPFEISKFDVTSNSEEIKSKFEEMEGKTVSVAGRIMSKRGQGKVGFYDIQDTAGRIQIFAKQDTLGEEEYSYFKTNDIGDIIGVTGEVFKTKMGEISVRAESVVLLSKSLQTLPEKFHGLKDTEIRYRQRYVDLIVNPEIKDVFIKRNIIIKGIREYLDNHGYMEVDTPVLSAIAGGANARPFITHHNTLDIDMYMRIANELYLKRLIVGGLADGVYEMGKMFRNEGMDTTHNPEYTAIELYKAYADYNDMMDLTENIIAYVCEKVNGTTKINYNGTDLDLTPPWRRVRMQDAVKEYTGIDFDLINTDEEAIKVAKTKKIEIKPLMTRGHVINALFEEYCEEHLIQPTFVTHHPVEISPLAKRNVADPRLTDRFEAFINTKEIANAFSELNDPVDQRERFEDQIKQKEAGDDEAHMMDYDFLNAIEVGLPPTGGLGIGVDRLIMFLTNQVSIRDIILFPTMKPVESEKKVENPVEEAPVAIAENSAFVIPEKIDFSKVEIEPLFADTVDFDTFSKSDFRAVKVLACEAVPKSKKLLKFTLNDGTSESRTILSGIHAFYEPEELVGKTLIAITNLPPRDMMGVQSCGMLLSAIHNEAGEEKLNLLMLDNRIPAGAKLY